MSEFEPFQKIARLSRECVVTEKIDGTNGQILIDDGGVVKVGSRNQWITDKTDNFGFHRWVMENREELITELGPGRHYGEWWGSGIQRGYGLPKGEKRFSLFNTHRWKDAELKVCGVVPVLHEGDFDMLIIHHCLDYLRTDGSKAAPGFMKPEGVVVFHKAANVLFKKTIEKDEAPKGTHQ